MDAILITMIRRPTKVDPKLRSLQESGTANPHAQDVRDPAFVDSDFFDPRDLIQVKYEMLRRVRTGGQPHRQGKRAVRCIASHFLQSQK